MDTLKERFKDHLNNLAAKSPRVDNHPYMLEFKKRYETGMHTTPDNLEESDLAITESQVPHIDPFTKRPLTDPVKNMVCGHIYEKNSIMNLIQINEKTKCPVMGCNNRDPITPQQLMSDEELKFQMRITKRSTMIQEDIMEL